MTENLLKHFSYQDLQLLALRTIEEYMELIKGSDLAAIERKRDDLILINNVIKEKQMVEEPQHSTSP